VAPGGKVALQPRGKHGGSVDAAASVGFVASAINGDCQGAEQLSTTALTVFATDRVTVSISPARSNTQYGDHPSLCSAAGPIDSGRVTFSYTLTTPGTIPTSSIAAVAALAQGSASFCAVTTPLGKPYHAMMPAA
jgi:hypothetical protein